MPGILTTPGIFLSHFDSKIYNDVVPIGYKVCVFNNPRQTPKLPEEREAKH